jgi:AraC-like DNA-binding protein
VGIAKTIPLVRAAVFAPFIDAARQIGVPVEKTLQAVRLPTLPADSPELLLPELPCWQFIQSVARKEGIADFGLLAANSTAHQDISTLTPLISDCKNLYDLLKRFCAVAPLQAYTAVYALEEKGGVVWFTQKGACLLEDDIQVQLFVVMGMIQLVQLAAGPDWRPAEIHFTFERRAGTELAPALNPGRILYSRANPAIAVPRHLLPLPLPGLNTPAERDAEKPAGLSRMPESFSKGLRAAIFPYLGEQQLSKKLLAEITGLSTRTLHRRLAEQHTSYSRVLDEARLLKAATLLEKTDAPLLEISLMLDYENASSFTRAFRRWTGVSPREYRHQHSPA